MRETIVNRLKRLEKARNPLPLAVVTFFDGHKESLDLHDLAIAFFERNQARIISVEWEGTGSDTALLQFLESPDTWQELTNRRLIEND